MKNKLLLQAFEGKNETVPVWFMRQAGRYLPQYQALKSKYTLNEMFRDPQIASDITVMPIDIIGVDAAILFADILTLPSKMGIEVDYAAKGPCLEYANLNQLRDFEECDHIVENIKLCKQKLNSDTALIGFAGSPYTVLTYIIEKGSSNTFSKTLRFMHEQKDEFHRLMDLLTKNTINYLNLQKEAGIEAFQLFDTWAGNLSASDYAHNVLPYVQKIFEAINLPSIYFLKNSNHLLALMNQTQADFLSIDHTVVLGHHNILQKTNKGVQGNLFNGLLYEQNDVLTKEINDCLVGGTTHQKYIFNLSHGVFPDTNPDTLKFIVDQVHNFKMPWPQKTSVSSAVA